MRPFTQIPGASIQGAETLLLLLFSGAQQGTYELPNSSIREFQVPRMTSTKLKPRRKNWRSVFGLSGTSVVPAPRAPVFRRHSASWRRHGGPDLGGTTRMYNVHDSSASKKRSLNFDFHDVTCSVPDGFGETHTTQRQNTEHEQLRSRYSTTQLGIALGFTLT